MNFLNEKYGGDKWKNHLDNTNLDWQGDKTAPIIQSLDSGKSGRIPEWDPDSVATVLSTYDEPAILGFDLQNGDDAHAAYVSLVTNTFSDNQNLYIYLGEIASEKDEYAMDHWMKLQKYVKELKNVTTRLGVRLIVIAQQNREGYNNGRGQAGGLGRVAGTLELSRICDCFINMYHTRDGDKIIALEKNRNGEMCKFKIDFDGARQIITIEEEILE